MSTRNIVKNIRSNAVDGNGPKLPTSGQLDYGEIAVNYKKGYETLSLKNDNNEIVSLSVNTVNDVTVNGTSVVSNKAAGITMKGETIPVADTYEPTVYPSPFEANAQHIVNTDKVDEALKKVETNISKLVSEIIDDEEVSAAAILKLAETAGTINDDGNVEYQKKSDAHYIKDAVSVHDATVILDEQTFSLADRIATSETNITQLKNSVNKLVPIEWVDLDLPSGTYWAKCNLGAASEDGYGNYYMWGSKTANTAAECTWANAPFNGGNADYNKDAFDSVKDTVCPNDILAKGYDAAYKATEGIARMPTKAEIAELMTYTEHKWVSSFNGIIGNNGVKFTSKTDTSKYIFIPAAGYYSNSSVNSKNTYVYVWSSSILSSATPIAGYCLGINSSGGDQLGMQPNRSYGLSIRPVKNT